MVNTKNFALYYEIFCDNVSTIVETLRYFPSITFMSAVGDSFRGKPIVREAVGTVRSRGDGGCGTACLSLVDKARRQLGSVDGRQTNQRWPFTRFGQNKNAPFLTRSTRAVRTILGYGRSNLCSEETSSLGNESWRWLCWLPKR